MALVFFKRPQHRRFNYKPTYYDPVKEELEERRKELGLIQEGDPQARFKAEMRRKWRREEATAPAASSRIIRIVVYLGLFVSSIYLIFYTNFLDYLVSIFQVK